MYCGNCGFELKDDALFCGECGCPVEKFQPSSETNAVNDFQPSQPSYNQINSSVSTSMSSNHFLKKINKKVIVGIAAVAAACIGCFFVFGMNKRSNGFQFKTDYKLYDASYDYVIMTDDNDHYGVLNYDGKVVVPFEYDKLEFLDKNQRGDMFLMMKNDGCGVINAHNKITISPDYDAVGYMDEYDSIYTISLSPQRIYVFHADGKEIGMTYYNHDGNNIRFYKSYVCNSKVKVVTNISLYGLLVEEDLNIMGLLSPTCFAFRNQYYLTVVDLTTQETLLYESHEGVGSFLYRMVTARKREDNYYIVREAGDSNFQRCFIIDGYGKKSDYAIVKDSKGKEVMRFKTSDYFFAQLLDDNGLCVLSTGNGVILKNIKTGQIFSEGSSFYYNDDKKIVIIRNRGDYTNSYTSYDYSGRKLHEYGDLYDRNSLAEVSEDRMIFGLGVDGLYVGQKTGGDDNYRVVYIDANGKEKEISSSGYMLSAHLNDTDIEYNNLQLYNTYYSLSNIQHDLIILNDAGDIIFSEKDSNIIMKGSNSGVCYQTYDKVIYWYNRIN